MPGFHQWGQGFYQRQKFKSESLAGFVLSADASFQEEMNFQGLEARETSSSDNVSRAFRPFLCQFICRIMIMTQSNFRATLPGSYQFPYNFTNFCPRLGRSSLHPQSWLPPISGQKFSSYRILLKLPADAPEAFPEPCANICGKYF